MNSAIEAMNTIQTTIYFQTECILQIAQEFLRLSICTISKIVLVSVLILRTLFRTFTDKGKMKMKTITITEARNNIYALIDMLSIESEPIQITGKRGNAVLISEDDWRAIKETLYLTSIPGMRESIIKGMREPLSKSTDKIKW